MNGTSTRASGETPWLLIGAAATLVALSFLVIRSASFDATTGTHGPLADRQLTWALISFALLAVLSRIPYPRITARADALYGFALVALGLVFAIGTNVNNSVRWFAVGSVRVQPSEFAKYALVVLLARVLALEGEAIRTLRGLAIPAALTAIPVALVAKQPDLTTACTYIPIAVAMVFVAGARTRHLAGAAIAAAASVPLVWTFLLHRYQKDRILHYLHPERGALGGAYQQLQSQIAIGSGGLFGKGFEGGTQGALGFIPERHTDFIFAVVGEEWGLAGGLVLLALYGALLFALARIAVATRDLEGRLIVTGIAAIVAVHVGVNVGMATGATPVAGIPLPFVSYGGSSLLANLCGLGLAVSVARHHVATYAQEARLERALAI